MKLPKRYLHFINEVKDGNISGKQHVKDKEKVVMLKNLLDEGLISGDFFLVQKPGSLNSDSATMMLRDLSVTIKGEAVLLDSLKVQNQTSEKTKHKPDPVCNPSKMSLYKIVENIVAGILILCLAWSANHYLGIGL